MKTVSIGFYRDDGDFAVLATLNNNDEHMRYEDFEQICKSLLKAITIADNHHHVVILERQDTPDYVEIN
jgi:hypothetical protein